MKVIALALVACGSPQHPAPSAPAPTCDEVARHLLELAERDNRGDATQDTATFILGEALERCHAQAWTERRRACLAAAPSQDQTLACPPQ